MGLERDEIERRLTEVANGTREEVVTRARTVFAEMYDVPEESIAVSLRDGGHLDVTVRERASREITITIAAVPLET